MSEPTDDGFDPEKFRQDSEKVEGGFTEKLRQTAGRIPFAEEALSAYFCAIDPATPLRVKGILMAALAYFVIPSDVIPDFLAVMGFTDDAAVLAAAVRSVLPHVKARHRDRARETLGQETIDGPVG